MHRIGLSNICRPLELSEYLETVNFFVPFLSVIKRGGDFVASI